MHAVKDKIPDLTPGDVMEHAKGEFGKLPAEEQEKIRVSFEQDYGTNCQTRTKAQWKRLVKKYSIETVMKQEGLTKAYIKAKLKSNKL